MRPLRATHDSLGLTNMAFFGKTKILITYHPINKYVINDQSNKVLIHNFDDAVKVLSIKDPKYQRAKAGAETSRRITGISSPKWVRMRRIFRLTLRRLCYENSDFLTCLT
jgi:hypothetical protein